MSEPLPKYWVKVNEPEAGPYKLISLAGWDVGGDPKNRKCLYILESMCGYLTEACEWRTEVGTVWMWVHGDVARKMVKQMREGK